MPDNYRNIFTKVLLKNTISWSSHLIVRFKQLWVIWWKYFILLKTSSRSWIIQLHQTGRLDFPSLHLFCTTNLLCRVAISILKILSFYSAYVNQKRWQSKIFAMQCNLFCVQMSIKLWILNPKKTPVSKSYFRQSVYLKNKFHKVKKKTFKMA